MSKATRPCTRSTRLDPTAGHSSTRCCLTLTPLPLPLPLRALLPPPRPVRLTPHARAFVCCEQSAHSCALATLNDLIYKYGTCTAEHTALPDTACHRLQHGAAVQQVTHTQITPPLSRPQAACLCTNLWSVNHLCGPSLLLFSSTLLRCLAASCSHTNLHSTCP